MWVKHRRTVLVQDKTSPVWGPTNILAELFPSTVGAAVVFLGGIWFLYSAPNFEAAVDKIVFVSKVKREDNTTAYTNLSKDASNVNVGSFLTNKHNNRKHLNASRGI